MFLPGEFHGLYSPWGCKESNTTEPLSLHKDNFNPLPTRCSLNPVLPTDQLIWAFVEPKDASLLEPPPKSASHYRKQWGIYKLSFTQWWATRLMSVLCIVDQGEWKEVSLFELEFLNWKKENWRWKVLHFLQDHCVRSCQESELLTIQISKNKKYF